LQTIETIDTERINIEGIKESFGRQVQIIPPSPLIKVLGKVTVFYEVVEETDVVTFIYKKIEFENLKRQFKAFMRGQITIKLEGPKNAINNLAKDNISLSVDCAALVYPGNYQLEVKLKKPDNIKIISIVPERVTINIQDK
jgi:hypothetical protein